MSSFCGCVGKADRETVENMVKTMEKNCGQTPVYFSDGYIHLGFIPYRMEEIEHVGHNDDFTIWAMVDWGLCTESMDIKQIIERYEKKGLNFLGELEGTFSMALWDGLKKQLYLVRDRYGAKPLFYENSPKGFCFAAEIKAVLEADDVKKSMNVEAIYGYVSRQSIYLPNTAFEGIYHVTPGCCGVYANGVYEEFSYADTDFEKECCDEYEVAADVVCKLLEESVRQCTEEHNTGIFLSGGLDSSVIAALAEKDKLKHAFCLKPITGKGSIHKKDEDVLYSSALAKEYGLEHHVVELTPLDLIESTDDIIKSFAQPFSGTVSTYFLAKKSAEICRKILTGDGADELFGSYTHHSAAIALEKYSVLKKRNESFIGREKELAPYENMIPFLEDVYRYGGDNDTLWYYRLLQMGDGEKAIFLNSDMFGELIEEQRTLRECTQWDKALKSKSVLNRCLERDFKHLLPGHTMLYSDTLAREFGINLGMPFMNNKLTNYVVSLPQEYKIKEGITKSVLKKAGEKVLPFEMVHRRKEPFSLPVTEWLKTDLKEYLTDILCEDAVKRYGILNSDCVQYAINEFYKYPEKKGYYGGMLWSMAMLQKWAMLYF